MSGEPIDVWRIARSVAFIYCAVCLGLYLMQDRLLYYPTTPVSGTPDRVGLAWEDVRLQTADGESLHAWYIPHPRARGTVLFFHGNAGNRGDRLHTVEQLARLGFSVLLPEYRGYGGSSGRPSERGLRADAAAAWDWLVDARGTPPGAILVFGRSLGGGVAAGLAAERQPAGLVLESTFTSVPDMAAGLYPWLPARWLSRAKFNAREALGRVRCPVLVIHAADDEIVPFRMGEALYEAAPEPKRFHRLGGGHNDAHFDAAYDAAWDDFARLCFGS